MAYYETFVDRIIETFCKNYFIRFIFAKSDNSLTYALLLCELI